jgi:hypothetical protein
MPQKSIFQGHPGRTDIYFFGVAARYLVKFYKHFIYIYTYIFNMIIINIYLIYFTRCPKEN